MQFVHKKIDYTVPSGHEGGPGIGKQFSWYVGTPYIDMTAAQWLAVHQSIGARLGDTWTLGGRAPASGGNSFQFVRTDEVLALGQLVARRPPTTTVDNAGGAAAIVGAAPTTAILTTNINNAGFATPVLANGDVDNWVWVQSAAATLPQLRRIKANTSSATSTYTVSLPDYMRPARPNDQDVFDTIPVAGQAVSIIRPYDVVVNQSSTYGAGTLTTVPVGVALGACAAGHYTIIQVRGFAAVQCSNSGAATVVNVPAIGAADGIVTGAGGTANLYTAGSAVVPQVVIAAAGPILTPCYVNFMAQ